MGDRAKPGSGGFQAAAGHRPSHQIVSSRVESVESPTGCKVAFQGLGADPGDAPPLRMGTRLAQELVRTGPHVMVHPNVARHMLELLALQKATKNSVSCRSSSVTT